MEYIEKKPPHYCISIFLAKLHNEGSKFKNLEQVTHIFNNFYKKKAPR